MHSEAVYGLAVDPINESIFASACDDGRVLVYDIRAPPSEGNIELAHRQCIISSIRYMSQYTYRAT